MTALTKIFWRIVLGFLLLFLAVYAGDYLYLRIRMIHPRPGDPFESLTRTRVLAIPQKNGKVEYQIDAQKPVESLTCVHSLFPHFGDPPCWYLKPRINNPIPMVILPRLIVTQPMSPLVPLHPFLPASTLTLRPRCPRQV